MNRPEPFVDEEIYHVYNRGVDKRVVFKDDKDHFRALHDLYEFNDTKPALNLGFSITEDSLQLIKERTREPIVEVLAFCLMPNHYHLMLRQLVEGGISLFMKKFGCGYTYYFNVRHARSGALFQGKFKAVHVNKEAHMWHLPHYIHLNPLDLSFPNWRTGGLSKNMVSKALAELKAYRWSSYLDYTGTHNYPSLTQRNFILDLFEGERNYAKNIEDWLTETTLEPLCGVLLE